MEEQGTDSAVFQGPVGVPEGTIYLFFYDSAPCERGCSLFDSGIVWRHGPYALMWIDLPDDVSLYYDLGDGTWIGRIEPQVFAAGANERYVVAKQHPGGNKRITNYFIIDIQKDSRMAEPKDVVGGPFTQGEFTSKSAELSLPPFTKVLESLE